ncbi:MAG: type IX secretion system membrane protein PorP/SprF [Bacteroidales bacterium]
MINKKHNFKALTLALFLFVACCLKTSAQQDPMYTQYMFNAMSINPGYAGLKGYPQLSYLSRYQWLGVKGAPKTQYLSYDYRVPRKNVGLGLNMVHYSFGPTFNTHMFVNYAYHLQLDKSSYLSMGIRAGLSWYKFNLASVNIIKGGDPYFSQDFQNNWVPNFGLGLYYYTSKYYLGISSPALLENKFKLNGDKETNIGKENRHYFFIAGYIIEITPDLIFKPSTLIRYVNKTPVSMDISALFLIRDRFWCGPVWRINKAVGFQSMFRFDPQWTLGYAFDYTMNELAGKQIGTHEIMLTYNFNKNTLYNIKSPRYF